MENNCFHLAGIAQKYHEILVVFDYNSVNLQNVILFQMYLIKAYRSEINVQYKMCTVLKKLPLK